MAEIRVIGQAGKTCPTKLGLNLAGWEKSAGFSGNVGYSQSNVWSGADD
jgi:hypothetical protein